MRSAVDDGGRTAVRRCAILELWLERIGRYAV